MTKSFDEIKEDLNGDYTIGDRIDCHLEFPFRPVGLVLDPIGVDKYGRVWKQDGNELVMIADFSANL